MRVPLLLKQMPVDGGTALVIYAFGVEKKIKP